MTQVGVIDYGVGNLHSVIKALEHVGADVQIVRDGGGVEGSRVLVLPGVGAFGDGMRALESRGLVEPLRAYARSGRPLLGICLGMQFLFEESDEFGVHRGLALLRGRVIPMPVTPGTKVPHVGWNRVFPPEGGTWEDTIFAELTSGTFVYFVHSYVAAPDDTDDVLLVTRYGSRDHTAAVRHENVWGCQFHPEKSGAAGLSILRRFVHTTQR
jgi:imidazole glycerol-phosphate synthase subunit HisH